MHRTWGSSLMTLPQRRPSNAPSHETQSSTTPHPPLKRFVNPSSRSLAYSFFFNWTRHTTSTVWGPGALTGKLVKHLGEGVMSFAEYFLIHAKLDKIKRKQPIFLGSVRELSPEETREIKDQCEKLVELCIVGMNYPIVFMVKAFGIILSGFKQPGREIWTHHIAEAISRRMKIEIFEILQGCFFFLLDESIFRIGGALDLQILSFRCPAVTHEIAVIISHLARQDYVSRVVLETSQALSLEPEDLSGTRGASVHNKASFSTIIIHAGFFRLATHWIDHGLPHWDMRGKSRLEEALQNVAYAQIYCGDLEKHSEEAMELIHKLRGRRLLLDDVPEAEETSGLDLGFEARSQVTGDDSQGLVSV